MKTSNWLKLPSVRREGRYFYKLKTAQVWVMQNPVADNTWHVFERSRMPTAGPFKSAKAAMAYVDAKAPRITAQA